MAGRLPVWSTPPEDEAVTDLRAQLTKLSERTVALELEVATLEGSLTTFQTVYLKRCGRLYAEIDEVDAEYARLLVDLRPDDEVLIHRAKEATAKAEASQTAAAEHARKPDPPKFEPSEELKSVFRRAARDMHPDHAPDEEQARIRHDWMVELNALYRRQDLEGIRALVADFKAHVVRSVQAGGASASALLESLSRKVAAAKQSIAKLERRLEDLQRGELHDLWARTTAAEAKGEDLLASLEAELGRRLRQARTRLEGLRRRRGSP